MSRVDFVGMKFGSLTVLKPSGTITKRGSRNWICQCECGNIEETTYRKLKEYPIKKCSKCRSKSFKAKSISNSGLYHTYKDMIRRCYNPKSRNYRLYGERGIEVCPEWQNSFETFMEWGIKSGYQEHLTIERIDVNGNYEPSNCTWIPRGEQGINRRVTHFIIYKGEKMPITWLADKVNVSVPTIRKYEKQFNGDYDALVDYVRNSKGYISSHKTRKENTKWHKKSNQQKTSRSRQQ